VCVIRRLKVKLLGSVPNKILVLTVLLCVVRGVKNAILLLHRLQPWLVLAPQVLHR